MRRVGGGRIPLLLLAALLAPLPCGAANDAGLDEDLRPAKGQPTGGYAAYLAGRHAARIGDADEAASLLGAAVRHGGGDEREVLTQAFLAAVIAGRPEAVDLARRLPDDPVAQVLLADHEAKAGRWEAAEARYAGLPQQGITQILRPLTVAWAQLGAGHTDAALATLRPMSEGQQSPGVYALHAALIADLGGRPGEAARLYRAAQIEYGAPNLRLGQILAAWHTRRGAAAEAQAVLRDTVRVGDLAMARDALEAAAAERAVRSATDGIAEAYLAMAATLRQQNATDVAQVVLRLALDLRPDFTPARLLMADLQDATRPEAALATLDAVPGADPLAAVVGLRRAGLLAVLGRQDEAAAVLERLAQTHPDRPEPLAQLGELQRRTDRFAEAAATYTRALERVREPDAAPWGLYYERGIAFERSGQWDRAEADFKRALALSPDQPYVLNYLAYSWADRGLNLDEARRMLERAAVLRPDDGAIADSLGWVLYRQGELDEAVRRLERAVELQPGDATINAHLGDAYHAIGRVQEAAFQWQRALVLKPEPDEAARIEAKLQALPAAQTSSSAASSSTPAPAR